MGKGKLRELESKGKITKRDMLIAMMLAKESKWDSEKRMEEERRILRVIKLIDGYLKEKEG